MIFFPIKNKKILFKAMFQQLLIKSWNFNRLHRYSRKSILSLNCYRKHSSNQPVNLSYVICQPNQQQDLTKDPLIILHGFLGSKTNWRSLGKAISAKYGRKVYILDARNHGDSPHSEEFDYPLMALDVKYFMQSLNVNRCILLGHSMGGRTAMILALDEPKLIEKLIVVDVSPSTMPESTSSVIPDYMKAMNNALKSLPSEITVTEARKLAEKHMSRTILDKGVCQFLLTNLTQVNQVFRWKANLDILAKTFESAIMNFPSTSTTYSGETLFICGGNSPYVSHDDHPYIRTIFPKAEFIYIPEAGHWVHSERPSEFLNALSQIL